jgi:hypothetical protein
MNDVFSLFFGSIIIFLSHETLGMTYRSFRCTLNLLTHIEDCSTSFVASLHIIHSIPDLEIEHYLIPKSVES